MQTLYNNPKPFKTNSKTIIQQYRNIKIQLTKTKHNNKKKNVKKLKKHLYDNTKPSKTD